MARAADYRRPNKFLLTSRPVSKGADPLHKWKRFKTMEEAEAVAESARKTFPVKRKSRQCGKRTRSQYGKRTIAAKSPVRKPHH